MAPPNPVSPCVMISRKTGSGREVGLYLAVGGVGVALDTSVFLFAMASGLGPVFSQWLGAGVGAVHNSLWHHFAVFRHGRRLRHTAGPNILLSLATVAASGPLLQVMESSTGSIFLAKAMVLTATTFATYFLRKTFIFKDTVSR